MPLILIKRKNKVLPIDSSRASGFVRPDIFDYVEETKCLSCLYMTELALRTFYYKCKNLRRVQKGPSTSNVSGIFMASKEGRIGMIQSSRNLYVFIPSTLLGLIAMRR